MDGHVRIEEVERAFGAWRRGKATNGGRDAIPEELWAQAARVASVHGVTKTAARLRLNATRLKERCELERSQGFVELAASELPYTGESVIELQDAEGMRMRVLLRGASVSAVTAAAKELWSMKR